MISVPLLANKVIYCSEDFLADQAIIGVRSSERNKEVLSITRVGQDVFYRARNVNDLFGKIIDEALVEHDVYWNSRLWC